MEALPEGQYVKHYRYGMGVVTESDDRQTSIDFDVHGLKRFVTTLMVVELSDLTPPPRVRAKHGAKVYARLASRTPGKKSASDRVGVRSPARRNCHATQRGHAREKA